MRRTQDLAAGVEGNGVHACGLPPGVVRTAMSTSMSIHENRTDWTDPEHVVELVAAIAAGELDQWSGRFVRAGSDDLDLLRRTTPADAARQLRLQPFGPDDPVG